MSKVKRQHYVPQFYLKRWANDIWVYDKERKKSFSSSIQSVASSNYFPRARQTVKLAENAGYGFDKMGGRVILLNQYSLRQS